MRERKNVTVPVDILQNRNLTTFDIGLFVYILANQNRLSKIEPRLLSQELKENKDTIRKGLVRLSANGYLTRESRLSGWSICSAIISPSVDQNLAEERPKFSQTSTKISPTEKEKEPEEKRTKREDKEKVKDIYNTSFGDLKEKEIREKENNNDKPDNKENTKEKEKPKRKPFVKPTLEEVKAYCRERESTVLAGAFFDWYESNGWKVGKNPMKDWKAAIRTWEAKDRAAGKYYVPPENQDNTKQGGMSEECPF